MVEARRTESPGTSGIYRPRRSGCGGTPRNQSVRSRGSVGASPWAGQARADFRNAGVGCERHTSGHSLPCPRRPNRDSSRISRRAASAGCQEQWFEWEGSMRSALFVFLLVTLVGLCTLTAQSPDQNNLLVVSIDGLDHRWLRDADALGAKIPTLRRLMSEGARADGVVGIVPTVTWPSHTTMITGVGAARHGIRTNDQPGKPDERWWYAAYLKAPTLWHRLHGTSRRTAAVWWPVTVGADIDFNLPEYWAVPGLYPRRLAPVAEQSTRGLIEKIRQAYPIFGRVDFGDRQKVLAARYILGTEKPALILLHLGDRFGSTPHRGVFSRSAGHARTPRRAVGVFACSAAATNLRRRRLRPRLRDLGICAAPKRFAGRRRNRE